MIYIENIKILWDENKNLLNLKKHGVDFYAALNAFIDPNAVIYFDDRNSTWEPRYRLVGLGVNGLLLVVYAEKSLFEVRVISVRKLHFKNDKKLKEIYEKNKTKRMETNN